MPRELQLTLCTVDGDGATVGDWRAVAANGVVRAHRLAARLPHPLSARFAATLPPLAAAVNALSLSTIPPHRFAEMDEVIGVHLMAGGTCDCAAGVTLTAATYGVCL